jgi:UDPglucose 6-dehydrogenase
MPFLNLAESAYELAKGCDALIAVTPWNEFKQLDMNVILQSMKGSVLIDGRNLYDPLGMREIGFDYRGVGRGYENNSLPI